MGVEKFFCFFWCPSDYIQFFVVIGHRFFCEIAKIIALKFCFRSFIFVVFMSSSVTEMWCTIEIIKDRGGSIKHPILHSQYRPRFHHLRQILPQCNNNKEPWTLSLSMSWSPANNQTFSWHRAPTTPLLPIFEGPRLTWFPENLLSVLSWSDLHW